MSSSVHVDSKKDILFLCNGPTQGSDDTTLTTEAEYSNNFNDKEKNCLSLTYNGSNSYLFIKYSEITPYSLCLGNISKYFSVNNIKEAELSGYVYAFLVDCFSINVDNILNIHKYLMNKNNIKWCFD